jgi:hypothetical protein
MAAIFWTELPFNVWDISVTEQPSFEEWYIAIRSGSCPELKGEDYDHRILYAMDSLYRIAYRFKLVFKFKFQGSVKVQRSLACMITLVAVLLSLPDLAKTYPTLSEREVQY